MPRATGAGSGHNATCETGPAAGTPGHRLAAAELDPAYTRKPASLVTPATTDDITKSMKMVIAVDADWRHYRCRFRQRHQAHHFGDHVRAPLRLLVALPHYVVRATQ